MKFTHPAVAILLILFFMTVLIAGCISAPEQTPTLLPTTATNNSQQNDDFTVHISKDGWPGFNNTGTITKKFSEIVANNYTDIPNLLEPIDYNCGYNSTTNYSQVADVALHDPHIQKALRNGSIIQGIYIWEPAYYPRGMNQENRCNYVRITLEFTYQKTQHGTARINETTRRVFIDPDVLQQFG